MKLIQNSNFRAQVMFFSTIVLYYNCITPLSGYQVDALSSHHISLARRSPRIYETISIIKIAINLSKNEGGSKVVWNFSKNSSSLKFVSTADALVVIVSKGVSISNTSSHQYTPSCFLLRSLLSLHPAAI